MASRTNDSPISLENLGVAEENWYGSGPRDFLAEGLLLVMTENQGVCHWAVDLEGGDNPAVLVAVDSAPDVIWRLYSPHFSDWVHVVLTDWGTEGEPTLFAQDIAVSPFELAWLRDTFEPGLITYSWPCPLNYRFTHQDKNILIWACENQTDWTVSAGSEQSLKDLAAQLWGIGELAQTLYSNDAVGLRILEEFRLRPPSN